MSVRQLVATLGCCAVAGAGAGIVAGFALAWLARRLDGVLMDP